MRTLAATRAPVGVDKTGVVQKCSSKVTSLAFERFEFRIGYDLDIEMAADLDQLG